MFEAYNISGLPCSLKFVEDIFQYGDFSTIVNNVFFNENQRVPRPYRRRAVIPNVFSMRPSNRPSSLISNLYVFETRNFNADRGVTTVVRPPLVEEAVNKFFEVYIDSQKYAQYMDDLHVINEASLSNWFATRTSMGKGGLDRNLDEDPYFYDLMNRFNYMVKPEMKCKLDYTAAETLGGGQNIVFHERRICALFSSIFQDLTQKLKGLLHSKFVLFTGMSFDEFAASVKGTLSRPLTSCYCGELDISKYDKSQNAFTKSVELEIYRRLGMHPDIVDLWATSEFSSTVGGNRSGINLDIGAQRRTGTATTWLGNTLINMVLLSLAGDISKFDVAAFSGDDSLLLAGEKFELSSFVYEYHYGFDVKFYSSATPYFCSKFLIPFGEKLYFVPDPIKLFVNLGIEFDTVDEVMRERFKSFMDLTSDYTSYGVCEILTAYVEEKYGHNDWLFPAICSVNSIRSNFAQFKRLWQQCYQLFSSTKSKFEEKPDEFTFD